MKSEISDKAKAVALKCMIMVWNENSKTKINNIKIEKNEDTSLDEMIADLPDDSRSKIVEETFLLNFKEIKKGQVKKMGNLKIKKVE
jgi:hypothetical protein